MSRLRTPPESPKLGLNEVYTFSRATRGTRLCVEWTSSGGMIADLDIVVLYYDERARFIEKLTSDNPVSFDGSGQLEADIDAYVQSASYEENVHFDLGKIDKRTAAIVLFVDGGPRNFQFVQSIIVHCSQENLDSDASNFMSKVEPGAYSNALLFQSQNRTRKDYQGVVLNVLFREGWNEDGTAQWHIKNVFEPLHVPTSREKDERCGQLVVATVPALDKYRPRLFPTVKAICSALSSTALPKLKKCFQKGNGLPIKQFTEVLFTQLYETNPRVGEDVEAAYTVALLQDMFSQIDFNGDGAVDWDEFTTFCIHTGLVGASGATGAADGPSAAQKDTLDEYVIEYGEDKEIKDTVLNSYSPLASMRYLSTLKRVMVIPEKRDTVMMFDNFFGHQSTLNPHMLSSAESHEKLKVYDILYIPSKDVYVYCASDHTIVICKEKSSLGGKKVHYTVVHRIFSSYLHIKLCWSEGSRILCSVAADNIIYGWELDGSSPTFHVSRHKDLVTDFISIDSMDIFATCSLDKRIVLWSQTSRRVKGVLLGHKRGVRVLSYGRGVLLSAGFECEARTWDINLKEPTLILKGHRMPVAAARMMCAPDQADDNLRALTVDDGGEFRLWNVFVKEKGSQCGFAQVLQVFTTCSNEPQVGRIRFFDLPFEPQSTKGNYSDIIAASSKLIHIVPEKNSAEFVPPTCVCYSEPNACVVTGIGHSMYKYDVSAGCFQSSINEIDGTDVTYLALDGEYGRRIFVGCTSGNIMLLNFASGAVLDTVQAHTKEVSAIAVVKNSRTLVFSGSFDGRIRCMEENSGELMIHNTADNAFGDASGITELKAVESIKVVVAASSGRLWGVWNMATLKKVYIVEEKDPIASIEVLGASGDKADIELHTRLGVAMDNSNFLTVAVCTLTGIRVYSMDTFLVNIAITHHLTHDVPVYISGMTLLRCPQHGSVNYTLNQATSCARFGKLFVAVTDEGIVVVWRAEHLRNDSLQAFKALFPDDDPSQGVSTSSSSDSGYVDTPDTSSSREEGLQPNPGEAVMSPADTTSPSALQESGDVEITSVTVIKSAPEDDESEGDETAGTVFALTSTSGSASIDEVSTVGTIPSNTCGKRVKTPICGGNVSYNALVQGEDFVIHETSIKSWRAHLDIIQSIVPLHEHGCFVTTSLDGFNRIWNLDSDCLGELQLPNVTEKMKAKRLNGECFKWKFIMEKIPVTRRHIDIAQKLVRAITSELPDQSDDKERRKAKALGGLGAHDMSLLKAVGAPTNPKKYIKTITADARDMLRQEMLMKLNAPDTSVTESSLVSVSHAQVIQSTPLLCPRADDDKSLSSMSDGSSSAKVLRGKLGGDTVSIHSLKSDTSKTQRSFASIQSLWMDTESLGTVVSAPFSESSITLSHQEGLIDAEGHKILRRVNADRDKVDAYNRSVPNVVLRNVGLSTKVELPPVGSLAESEVSFGNQKTMYKNANKCYAEKRKYSSAQARHVVSLSRIKANVRRMGNMVHVEDPPTHDLISLPPIKGTGDDDEDEVEIERERQRLVYNALSKSRQGSRRFSNIGFQPQGAKKQINKERVAALLAKINDAENSSVPDWEIRQQKVKVGRVNKKILNRSNTAAQIAMALLEKKLSAAIRNNYRDDVDSLADKKMLTTRILLPFYKMSDVKHFLDIFQKVDEDYSGDLDPDEWCKFFTSLNKTVTEQQARAIFNRVDVHGDGFLSIRDLIPVVFSKASKEVRSVIVTYVEAEVSKRKIVGKDFLKESDLQLLFQHYDENVVGFVPVSLLRDKVRAMQLPEVASYEVLASMKEMEDDEMVNCSEFVRIFRNYLL